MRGLAGSLAVVGAVLFSAACGDSKSVALFDGKTLTGWDGDARYWRVADGAIVGSTDAGPALTQNTYLRTTQSFADFDLRVEWKLRNHNSGIQFRGVPQPSYGVRGYQSDIADEAQGYLGILYDDGGRGFLSQMRIDGVYDYVDLTDWNETRISAIGPHVLVHLNGHLVTDFTETLPTAPTEGVIAFQLHVGNAMEVRYRAITLGPRAAPP